MSQEWDRTVERIFVTEEPLDLNLRWWTSPAKIYPIQKKVWSRLDPVFGYTFKYVCGISEMIEEQMGLGRVLPASLETLRGHDIDRAELSMFNVILPSLDSDVYGGTGYGSWTMNPDHLDTWTDPDIRLCESSIVRGTRLDNKAAQSVIDTATEPFFAKDITVSVNPINNSWAMYDFLMSINDLAVPVVKVFIDLVNGNHRVILETPYNGYGDLNQCRQYPIVRDKLIQRGCKAIKEAFEDRQVTRLAVSKLWSEEIYMTAYVECPGRSSSIDINYYVDLPMLMVGTVGLR